MREVLRREEEYADQKSLKISSLQTDYLNIMENSIIDDAKGELFEHRHLRKMINKKHMCEIFCQRVGMPGTSSRRQRKEDKRHPFSCTRKKINR